MSRSRLGQFVAVLFGVIVIGVIVWGVLRSPQPDEPGPEDVDLTGVETPRLDSGAVGTGLGGDEFDAIRNLVWTRTDPKTGRVQARLAWESLEPLAEGRFDLASPEAWIYERSSLIHMTAASGRFLWLSRAEQLPESGDLAGDVVVRVYDLSSDWSGDPADVIDDLPLAATIRTESLHFESTLGELSTRDDITLDARGASFDGRGLVLRISEVARFTGVERRLQYLRINEGRRLVVRPGAEGAEETSSAGLLGGGGGDDAADDEVAAATPSELLYHLTIEDDVALRQGGRLIASERVDAFARLIDRRLPADAITPIRIGNAVDGEHASSESGGDGGGNSGAGEASLASDEPVELTWTGPLEVRTSSETPDGLVADDLYVSFVSPRSGRVTLSDEASGLSGRFVRLDYGFTSQRLMLQGLAGRGVELTTPDGELLTSRLDLDLDGGTGRLVGPGSFVSTEQIPFGPDDPESWRPLHEGRWSDGAAIAFDVDDRGEVIPRSIELAGDVDARSGDQRLRGATVAAEFDAMPPDDAGAAPWIALTRVAAREDVRVSSPDGWIEAASIDARFDRPAKRGELGAMAAIADGGARAHTEEGDLRARSIELEAVPDGAGQLRARRVEAREGVETTLRRDGGERIEATGDRLTATIAEEGATIDIVGAPANVHRSASDGEGELTVGSIRLIESTGELLAFGAGEATQTMAPGPSGARDELRVSWTSLMSYTSSDEAARVSFSGDVASSGVTDGVALHEGRGERFEVGLRRTDDGWVLTEALTEGDSTAEGADRLAQLETRVYRTAAMDEIETLGMLSGPVIEAKGLETTDASQLRVPGAGVLLLEDRRERAEGVGEDAGDEGERVLGQDASQMAGTSVFDWRGSMQVEGGGREIEMSEQVRLRHRPLAGGDMLHLECERLLAWLSPRDSAASDDPLERVLATGAVFARQGDVELICDQVEYVSERGVLVARANEGNVVTLLDRATGSHYRSDAVEIDIRTGEWRSVGGQAVTVPW